MGNIMKKETPLEKSKREADKQRAAQLKAKRRNTAREWDPSGTGEQGPGIVNHEEEAAPQAGSQGGKDPNRVTSSCCT